MKKIIVCLFTMIICTFAMAINVSADNWVKTEKGYKYQYDDGSYAKKGWLYIDGKKYYITKNGVRKKGWLTTSNGTKYYFGKNGAALKGWYKIAGKKYYFDNSCKMATGEVIIGDWLYYIGVDGVYDDYCYSIKLTEARKTLRIHDKWVKDIDSVGGVDISIAWENMSPKTIKYIYFTVTPYNAVGDVVSCRITDDSTVRVYCTGPYAQYEGGYFQFDGYLFGSTWENVWYRNSVDYFTIDKVEIEYMDGSNVTLSGEDLKETYFLTSITENGI